MALKHPLRVFGTLVAAGALTVTLLPVGAASAQTLGPGTSSVSVEPASKKKKGPPPGTSTRQLQRWIEDYYRRTSICPGSALKCSIAFKWSKLRWLGMENAGSPYRHPIYIAQVDLLRTVTTPPYEVGGVPQPGATEQTMYGWWDGGRRSVPGAYQGSHGLDYAKRLYVWRTNFGQWQFGWGNYSTILR